jgi:diaminohydroxyphosphoribosylaminopyrimidine deaminase/5-amino-6-(5-phosphoribosylamino)uracil reductase
MVLALYYSVIMYEMYMRQALRLAEKGRYSCSPNPMVGCVLVRDNQVIAQGWHQHAGGAHAEVNAIVEAGNCRGATAYVTLEPCDHYGKTPPCTQALIAAGVAEVVVGCLDPNPLVAGRGVAALRAAGLSVTVGVCEAESQAINQFFFHAIIHERPYVIAKWAMSFDGKMATRSGDSKWITGKAARHNVHELRHQVDAILVGMNTAIVDNPQLTARKLGQKIPDAEQPQRIVLDGVRPRPEHLALFKGDLPGKTWLASELVAGDDHKLINLLMVLHQRGLNSLLIEGGSQTLTQFLDEDLVDEIHCYIAPKLIGGAKAAMPYAGNGIENMLDARRYALHAVEKFDEDVCLIYRKLKEQQHV